MQGEFAKCSKNAGCIFLTHCIFPLFIKT